MAFLITTPVWGKEFTELFINVVLPNFMAENALPYLHKKHKVKFNIYTTEEDCAEIKQSPVFSELSRVSEVEFVFIEDMIKNDKHNVISYCHAHSIENAVKNSAVLLTLPPDQIYSENMFTRIEQLHESGVKAVMVAGIRVAKETFIPEFMERAKKEKTFSVPSEILVGIMLGALHPITKSLFWETPYINVWPSHIYWKVRDEGFIARCFHLHPLMIDIGKSTEVAIDTTIDGTFIQKLGFKSDEIYIVTDSDEITACEISGAKCQVPCIKRKPSRVSAWAKHCADNTHRDYFRRNIFFHTKKTDGAWNAEEEKLLRVADRIFFYLHFPYLLYSRYDVHVIRMKLDSLVVFFKKIGLGRLLNKISVFLYGSRRTHVDDFE